MEKYHYTIGDNAGTDGLYLNFHDPVWDAKYKDDPMAMPLYYLHISVQTEAHMLELLKLAQKWNRGEL
jgi:hypothetical protein